MKAGIHPDYHKINVVMTDGTKYETYSTYGKEGDTLQLDVDSKTHPAWIGGGATINQRASQVAKFNNRFGSLGGGIKTVPKAEAKADDSAAAEVAAKPVEKKAEAKPAAKKVKK